MLRLLRLIPLPALAALAVIFGAGYKLADWRWQRIHDATVAEHAATLARVEAESARLAAEAHARARIIEQRHAADLAAIAEAHQEALRHATTQRDRSIADLRADALRVRERFTCPDVPEAPGDRAAEAPARGQLDHEGARGGLSRADAEFLLHLAAEADDVVRQLHACQAVVRRDRER